MNGHTPSEPDSAVYPELANANLQRMRGDLKAAEVTLLAVLRRFPNNPSAHEMLGDLAIEKNDLQHAVEWYELALDLAPDSPTLIQKLEAAKDKHSANQTDDTASQIGLAPEQSRTPLYVLIFIIGLLVVGAIAYTLGNNSGKKAAVKDAGIVRTSITPPSTTENPAVTNETVEPTTTTDQTTPATTNDVPGETSEDKALQQLVSSRSADGARVLSVARDPRTNVVILTFSLGTGEDPRPLAARLGRTVLQENPESQIVTLRALQGGNLQYIADMHRSKMQETETAAQADPTGAAWMGSVLMNEWSKTPAERPNTAPGATEPGVNPTPAPATGSIDQ